MEILNTQTFSLKRQRIMLVFVIFLITWTLLAGFVELFTELSAIVFSFSKLLLASIIVTSLWQPLIFVIAQNKQKPGDYSFALFTGFFTTIIGEFCATKNRPGGAVLAFIGIAILIKAFSFFWFKPKKF